MSEEERRPVRGLPRAREEAAAALGEAFAGDELDVDEFEARLDRCWRARDRDELEDLFEDLSVSLPVPAGEGGATDPGPTGAPVDRREGASPSPRERRAHDLMLGLMSGVGRGGRWTPPRHTNAVAVMGGVELDFREARFPPGETTVHAVALMGGVEIIVPPGLRVTSSGIALMGGYDRLDQEDDGRRAPGAELHVRGVALMGGVEVRVADPGDELPRRGR